MRLVAWLFCGALCGVAAGAPVARFDGARASFAIPAGTRVSEGSDIAADWALDVAVPTLPKVRVVVLGGDAKVGDAELETQSTVWRDKRLRNRASWGVPHEGEHRVEQTRVGGKHAVRLIDDLSSTMSGRQIMLCTITASHLTCAIATGPQDVMHAASDLLDHTLDTLKLK